MHKPKFKVGDVIKSMNSGVLLEITHVVHETQKIICNWYDVKFVYVTNGYVFKNEKGYHTWANFNYENNCILISENRGLQLVTENLKNYNCPRCGKELFLKKSEYTGGTVRKCSCGWCD